MTISSLAKFIAGVNRMVVENVEIESPEINPTLVISVRPTKRDSGRCPFCEKKCSGYDQGNGRRRWRALDIGCSTKVYLESDSPRVWCREHGVVVQMVPWARHGSKHTRNFEDTAVWMTLHLSGKLLPNICESAGIRSVPWSAGWKRKPGQVRIALTVWSRSELTKPPTRKATSTSPS